MSSIRGGLDEVGWGSLAGPIISVVAAFRDIDLALMPPGVRDSKKATVAQRNSLYLPLCKAAYDVGIGHAWPWEIDDLGPMNALQLSYTRALAELHCDLDILIVDGSSATNLVRSYPKAKQRVEPKADVNYKEVSAASIIAKVFRDQIMADYSKKFPVYGWSRNSGYGSDEHQEAIRKYGLLMDPQDHSRYIHRRQYCRKFVTELGLLK